MNEVELNKAEMITEPSPDHLVAPAFGKLGYGIQYKTPVDVNSLIEFKFIIPIK